jgi:hypothetical protein
VDLRDGRRGDRDGLERGEEPLEGSAELRLDGGAHGVEAKGRHLVAQARELAEERVGQEVAARRGDLPDLDEGRPEPCAKALERAPRSGEPAVAVARGAQRARREERRRLRAGGGELRGAQRHAGGVAQARRARH